MRFKFAKMHGLGNDFIVIDATQQHVPLSESQARYLADRKFGIGCDQILLVEAPQRDDVDFNYRILNADGGEVEQCGNGARCFASFVRREGLTDKTSIRVLAGNSIMTFHADDGDEVTVDMGVPQFEPASIPFVADQEASLYLLELRGTMLPIAALALGNPHAVHRVENVDRAAVEEYGPAIESHPRFPNRVNAGFMEIVDRSRIRLRVYERGVGETMACGSGACAALVAAREWGVVDSEATIELRGGKLDVSWQGRGHSVMMTGPATHVFNGEIEFE